MKIMLARFRKSGFHAITERKPNGSYCVLVISVFVTTILLISGCTNSTVPGVIQPTSSSQITNSVAGQSPINTPTPQKPGILSRKTFNMSGSSMEPTLKQGDRVAGYPVWRDLQRGDIVVFTSPDSNKYTMISRIIGLPGETIEVEHGQVIINGVPLNEPYIAEPPTYLLSSTIIPGNAFITFGDNRNHSFGSQNFGPVPLANIHYIIEQ
jgi:signal peptidase I